MPSTYTSGLRLTNQGTGENAQTWGDISDDNYEFLDDAITGIYKANMTGAASYTLTIGNGTSDQARSATLEIFGIPTSATSLIIPASEKIYQVRAYHTSVTGGITVRTNAGTGVRFLTGESATLECDGVSVYNIGTVSALDPSDNLSDLQNISAARVNLSVYSIDAVDTKVSTLTSNVTSAIAILSANVTSALGVLSAAVNISNAGTFAGSLFYIRDQKTTGTGGGSLTAGTWTTRAFNTIIVSAPFATLTSNIITLASGNYMVEWRTPGYGIGTFKSRLNTKAGVLIDEGTSEYSPLPGNDQQNSFGFSYFNLSVLTSVRVQIRGASTNAAATALGVGGGEGTYEVYSLLRIWKRGN